MQSCEKLGATTRACVGRYFETDGVDMFALVATLPTAGREVDKEGRQIDAGGPERRKEATIEGCGCVAAPFIFMIPSATLP